MGTFLKVDAFDVEGTGIILFIHRMRQVLAKLSDLSYLDSSFL